MTDTVNHPDYKNECPDINGTQVLNVYQSLSKSAVQFVPILIALAIAIFFTNLAFIILVIRRIRLSQLPRKRYYFELNRSIADLVAVTVAFCGGCTIASQGMIHYTYSVLNISIIVIANSTFITVIALTTTYVATTLLQYLAITRPFIYHQKVTPRKCIYAIVACWGLAVLVGPIPEIMYFVNACHDQCLNYLTFLYVVLLFCSFVATLIVFFAALILLYRKNERTVSTTGLTTTPKSKWYGMKNIALYLFIYSITYLPLFILIFINYTDVGYLFELLKQKNLCDFQTVLTRILDDDDPDFGNNVQNIVWAYIVWNLRALWDPITTCLMEPVLRKRFFSCRRQTSSPRGSSRSYVRTVSRASLFA